MEKLIPSPVTSIEEQATGQAPVSHAGKCIYKPSGKAGEYSALVRTDNL